MYFLPSHITPQENETETVRTTLARPPPYASEWEVYTLAPVLRVGSVAWSPMALDQMFNGGGGVIDADLVASAAAADDDDKSKQTERGKGEKGVGKHSSTVSTTTTGFAKVYGCGTLVCYSSVKPSAVRISSNHALGFHFSRVIH